MCVIIQNGSFSHLHNKYADDENRKMYQFHRSKIHKVWWLNLKMIPRIRIMISDIYWPRTTRKLIMYAQLKDSDLPNYFPIEQTQVSRKKAAEEKAQLLTVDLFVSLRVFCQNHIYCRLLHTL